MTELRMSLINQDMPDGKPVGMSAYHAKCVDYSPKPLHYSTGKTKCQATNRKIRFAEVEKTLFAQTEKNRFAGRVCRDSARKAVFLERSDRKQKGKKPDGASRKATLCKQCFAKFVIHPSKRGNLQECTACFSSSLPRSECGPGGRDCPRRSCAEGSSG